MKKLIDFDSYPVRTTLQILLKDKTTKNNIIWATDAYAERGHGFQDKNHIDVMAIKGLDSIDLQSRTEKAMEEQQERTRKKAEVFTPVWLCNKMNNYADEQWFGKLNVFNTENKEEHNWTVNSNRIQFDDKNTWKSYVDSRRLEITCGEAPYLVSRYDATTGELILPPFRRIGILDRKLRVVNENVQNNDEWLHWTLRAYQSCYGYEYQGDNLLIARINLIMTFADYFRERMGTEPDDKILKQFANVVAWNIWQMDGLKNTVPLGKPHEEYHQMSIFDIFEEPKQEDIALPCKIKNWRANETVIYKDIKKGENMGKKLFDFAIGNPPYQEEFSKDGNKTYAAPVYNKFMDASAEVAKSVELIHPARFLFNAGSTPKAWNEKMLNNVHFKVMHYEEDASKVFTNTDIKGGVAITYQDSDKNFEPVIVFTKYPELNAILKKVKNDDDFTSMETLVVTRTAYRLMDKMHQEHPEAIGQLSKGHAYDMSTNIFERLPQVFYDSIPADGNDYIRILGRENNTRVYKYIRADYVNEPINLHHYKVIMPKANGTGCFGELISMPLIIQPETGTTETFISIGKFDTEYEAENCLKYIFTKFARAMLSILKTTQDLTPEKWRYVPQQSFTVSSDIDWSKSIHEIDQQLYQKYDLTDEEIQFIETNVKEMV